MPHYSEEFFVDQYFPRNSEIPFGERLENLFFNPRSDNKDFPIHGPNVIRFSKALLRGDILESDLPDALSGLLSIPDELNEIRNLFRHHFSIIRLAMEVVGPELKKEEEFLRICALYHDIGKVIRRANHPQIGTNLLRNSQEDETRKLIASLHINGRSSAETDSAENRFARLCSVVQHHDKFGVVSTGEGGLPIFSDIPYFRSDSSKLLGIKKNITTVMLLNLADIAAVNKGGDKIKDQSVALVQEIRRARDTGSDKNTSLQELLGLCLDPKNCKGLTLRTISDVLSDWEILIQAVEENKGDRGLLKKRLLEFEQNPSRAIRRIQRLLTTTAVTTGAEVLEPQFSLTSVESVLVGALGDYQLQSFCDQLASVVKFDYGLGFFEAIICSCIRRKLENKPDSKQGLKRLNPDEIEALHQLSLTDHREIAQTATERFVQVIKGLLGRYVGVLGSAYSTGRRFGIQMQTLSSDATVLTTIMDFLCMKNKEFVAVTWIADEVSFWSLD